jgi:eukaryotic-like serine/threonine-protein kinase
VTPERWKKVAAIFEQALELPTTGRAAFLKKNCNRDGELRREVESLLESHASAGSFIDEPGLFFSEDELKDDVAAVAPGHLIGAYRVIREIGRGGMGTVYLAERADQQYEKQVAIKLIKRGMDTDSVLRHFRKERQILAGFDHPNIARLFDGGTTEDGLPYFVMEYVEGLPIDEYCDAHRLGVAERLKLFREVCAAVSYAHRRLVIHRDIKRSNILVTSEGVPKLLDFGIAKILQTDNAAESMLTLTGMRPMTPEYASPEQVRGDPVTAASDVYSLGVVLYELLTGSSPYRLTSHSPREVERAITEQEPTPPSTATPENNRKSVRAGLAFANRKSLRGDIDNIVLMALRKEPGRRYQSVDQFADDIRRYLEARPVLARKDTLVYRAGKFIRRNPVLVGAASVCALLALVIIWLTLPDFTAPTLAPQKSIAVLPFQNISADPGNAYLADGIQEEILTRLSKIADLKVISRASAQRYKSKPANVREVAQQLGVAHLLEGTVQKAADQVRVNVELINAQTGSYLWADKFDRNFVDIFSAESEIATKIAETLQAKLSGSERRAISAYPTKNTKAYDLYLKGRYHWRNFYAPGYERVREYYEQAIALDPSYAPAYVGLSVYHSLAAANGIFSPDHWPLAEEALRKALSLDDALPEAYNALAAIEIYYKRNWPAAERAFRRGIELDPNFGELRTHYGLCLSYLGRFSEAIDQNNRGLELDPFFQGANLHYGVILFFSRDYERAAAQWAKTLEIFPDYAAAHDWLGEVCAKRGMAQEAINHWCAALKLNGQSETAQLVEQTFTTAGFEAAVHALGQRQLQELDRKRARGEYVAAANYVFANLRCGKIEEAIRGLPKMVEEPNWFALQLRVNPVFDPLRADPRFEKIASSVTFKPK